MDSYKDRSRSSTYSSQTDIPPSQPPKTQTVDVPGSVRSLLLSTKRLQELLREWSEGRATETQVSDVFVEIGVNLNTMVYSEIHSVPQELRTVLEQCLSEDPSPEVLDSFMPEVRRILTRLLRELQARQEAWKVTIGRNHYDYR